MTISESIGLETREQELLLQNSLFTCRKYQFVGFQKLREAQHSLYSNDSDLFTKTSSQKLYEKHALNCLANSSIEDTG